MTFIKKNYKIIIIVLIIIFIVYKIISTFSPKEEESKELHVSPVEVFSLSEIKKGNLDTFCSVETATDAALIAETSGKVESIKFDEGDFVEKGDLILELENINQRLAVQNARVSLQSAELALSELLNDNGEDTSSLLNQTETQQNINVSSARNSYLNNDLMAYPEDYDEDSERPIVSGNYQCDTEGEYVIEVYSSAAKSGASVNVSGLENGRVSVSTDYSVPLLNCGLEIVFPKEFKKDKKWIIPVPNTRSANYISSKNTYANALSGKDLVLNQTQASPERIAQERSRVSQARLQLESAQHQLNKSYIKASVSGTLTDFNSSIGDFISMNQEVAKIKSIDDLELIAYVSPDEKKYISIGSRVTVGDSEFTIQNISPSVGIDKKIKVTVSSIEKNNLTEGTELVCSIERTSLFNDSEDKIVPLSAVSIIGTHPYIFELKNGIATKREIETGAILGDSIIIYGTDFGDIIRDARSIRDGQKVIVK